MSDHRLQIHHQMDLNTLKELRAYIRDEISSLEAGEKVILMLIQRLHTQMPVMPKALRSPPPEPESVAPYRPTEPTGPVDSEEEERQRLDKEKRNEKRRTWYTSKFKMPIARLLHENERLTAKQISMRIGATGEYIYPILKHDPWFEKVGGPAAPRPAEFQLTAIGREEYAKSQVA